MNRIGRLTTFFRATGIIVLIYSFIYIFLISSKFRWITDLSIPLSVFIIAYSYFFQHSFAERLIDGKNKRYEVLVGETLELHSYVYKIPYSMRKYLTLFLGMMLPVFILHSSEGFIQGQSPSSSLLIYPFIIMFGSLFVWRMRANLSRVPEYVFRGRTSVFQKTEQGFVVSFSTIRPPVVPEPTNFAILFHDEVWNSLDAVSVPALLKAMNRRVSILQKLVIWVQSLEFNYHYIALIFESENYVYLENPMEIDFFTAFFSEPSKLSLLFLQSHGDEELKRVVDTMNEWYRS